MCSFLITLQFFTQTYGKVTTETKFYNISDKDGKKKLVSVHFKCYEYTIKGR